MRAAGDGDTYTRICFIIYVLEMTTEGVRWAKEHTEIVDE